MRWWFVEWDALIDEDKWVSTGVAMVLQNSKQTFWVRSRVAQSDCRVQ